MFAARLEGQAPPSLPAVTVPQGPVRLVVNPADRSFLQHEFPWSKLRKVRLASPGRVRFLDGESAGSCIRQQLYHQHPCSQQISAMTALPQGAGHQLQACVVLQRAVH